MEEYEFKERLVIIKYLGLISCAAFLVISRAALLFLERFGIPVYCAVYLISSAILGAATLALYSIKGLVRADQNGVNIKILLFGKTLSERSYTYSDIKGTSCTVEKHKSKNVKYYDMVFVFLFAGGKKLRFSKRLKIRFNIEKKDPSAFYSAVSGENMMQLNAFVRENRTRVFHEKYPE